MSPIQKMYLRRAVYCAAVILVSTGLPCFIYCTLWGLSASSALLVSLGTIVYCVALIGVSFLIDYSSDSRNGSRQLHISGNGRIINLQNPKERAILDYVETLSRQMHINVPHIIFSAPAPKATQLDASFISKMGTVCLTLSERWLQLPIENLPDNLLKVVIAHELSHVKNRDGLRINLLLAFDVIGQISYALHLIISACSAVFFYATSVSLAGFLLATALTTTCLALSTLFTSWHSQSLEHLADLGAAQNTGLIPSTALGAKKLSFHELHWGRYVIDDEATDTLVVTRAPNPITAMEHHHRLNQLENEGWESGYDALASRMMAHPERHTLQQWSLARRLNFTSHPTDNARKRFIQESFPEHFRLRAPSPR